MSFSSLTFIFYFLPIFFVLYYLIPAKNRDLLLAGGSLLFYAWGDVKALPILLMICLITYFAGQRAAEDRRALYAGAALDLAVLMLFKYVKLPIGFPLGISFYMFHSLSYLFDCSEKSRPADSFRSFLVYMCMFPKLVMGPIMTWEEFDEQHKSLTLNAEKTAEGIALFCLGLSEKALLAGPLGTVSRSLWADAPSASTSAWCGLIAFGLQLYYDFAGYSNMARGLGLMAGYHIGKNFDHPYTAVSVSEFWRRWHMTLGAWFKRYLYFPLGGSRKGLKRTLVNLMIVWAATGIWHGNTAGYLVWGLGLGLIICFEKLTRFSERVPKSLGWLWTQLWIFSGWVFFNTENFADSFRYFGFLFSGFSLKLTPALCGVFHDNWMFIIFGLIFAGPFADDLLEGGKGLFRDVMRTVIILFLFGLSVLMIVNEGYSAFIYTKF